MGQRGPKPLPANVHKLHGNPSKLAKHRLTGTVEPDVVVPNCPAHLLPDAKKEWNRVTPLLKKLGIISELDRAALAVYCQAYARWVQAEKKLKELGEKGLIDVTPSGYKQIGVWFQVSNRAVEQMNKALSEFGMSPSSRSRASASPMQGDLFGNDKPDEREIIGPGRFFAD